MKKILKEMAKERLRDALANAYYHFTDECSEEYNNLSEDEKQQVLELVDKYGKAMCRVIGKEYYTV